jgi:hypothetical protein
MVKKILAVVIYLVLFLAATVLFTYFLFPLDPLREYVESKTNTSIKYRLEIGSIEREGLGTLVFTDISVGLNRKLLNRRTKTPNPLPEGKPGEAGREDAEDAEETPGIEEFSFIDIDSIYMDIDLSQLLDPSRINVGLDVELLGGFIEHGELVFHRGGGTFRVGIHLPVVEDIQLGDSEFFATIFSSLLPSVRSDQMTGYISECQVELDPQGDDDGDYYSGSVELELGELIAVSPILVQRIKKTGEVVEVPLTDMRLGNCNFKLRVDRKSEISELDKVRTKHDSATAVLFEKAECKGESLDYYIQENSFIIFPLKGGFAKGKMDFWTKLAFNPDYFEEETKDESGQPVTRNKELGQGLEFDRYWQKAQDTEGFYWMHCQGTVGKPKCRRGLPPEEKKKKEAIRDIERKKQAEETRKQRDKERKKSAQAAAAKKAAKTAPLAIGKNKPAAKKKSTAKERAERLRRDREKKRNRPNLSDLRTPSGPEEQPEEDLPEEGLDEDEELSDDGDEPLEDEEGEEYFDDEEEGDPSIGDDEEDPDEEGILDDEEGPSEDGEFEGDPGIDEEEREDGEPIGDEASGGGMDGEHAEGEGHLPEEGSPVIFP